MERRIRTKNWGYIVRSAKRWGEKREGTLKRRNKGEKQGKVEKRNFKNGGYCGRIKIYLKNRDKDKYKGKIFFSLMNNQYKKDINKIRGKNLYIFRKVGNKIKSGKVMYFLKNLAIFRKEQKLGNMFQKCRRFRKIYLEYF